MSGGPKYEYQWQDEHEYRKLTALSAPQYMNLQMDWIEVQISNEDIFPNAGEFGLGGGERGWCRVFCFELLGPVPGPGDAVARHPQNQRMVGVGRALCGSPSPTPCRSRVTQSRLHSTASRRSLNVSREGDSTASLGSLSQGSVTLRGKKFFLGFFRCYPSSRASSFVLRRGWQRSKLFRALEKLQSSCGLLKYPEMCQIPCGVLDPLRKAELSLGSENKRLLLEKSVSDMTLASFMLDMVS